jgi:uncharacterized protein YukE
MSGEIQLGNKVAALNAAASLDACGERLRQTVDRAAQLVQQTQQSAPLWGDDEAGRRYRANYANCEQVLQAVQRLGEVFNEVGRVCRPTVEALIEADERVARSFGD